MYSQLTLLQRLSIEKHYAQGMSQSAIARELGVHRSTVKRELDRNTKAGDYKAEDAHAVTLYRKRMQGTLSQLGKKVTAENFQRNTKRLSKKKKAGLSKCRCAGRHRKQFRARPYQFYTKRKDERSYRLHPNKNRSDSYRIWKSIYESNYRFRDNAEAERKRLPRTRKDFLAYFTNTLNPALRFERKDHLAWRKIKRAHIERNERRCEGYMHQLDKELRQIRQQREEKQREEQGFCEATVEHDSLEVQPTAALSFLYIFWIESPAYGYLRPGQRAP